VTPRIEGDAVCDPLWDMLSGEAHLLPTGRIV
jgi:hypothetical protein